MLRIFNLFKYTHPFFYALLRFPCIFVSSNFTLYDIFNIAELNVEYVFTLREITFFNDSKRVETYSTLILSTIEETKIGSMVQSIWESQSFHSLKLKPGQLTVLKEFVGTLGPEN